jgi:DNA-binding NtrC family response regulator
MMKPGERVLLSFVGRRDPFQEEGAPGPLLCLLGVRSMDHVYLFFNPDRRGEFLRRARELQERVERELPKTRVELVTIAAEPPTDYELLFKCMNHACQQILAAHPPQTDFAICLDSGTPQMQTIWFLLAQSGLMPARLLQGVPPQFGSGEYSVREVTLSLDSFPAISSPAALKRQLDILQTRVRRLETERATLIRDYTSFGLVGRHPAFLAAVQRAQQAAQTDASVLLAGETGTGKDLFARMIHYGGSRRSRPFISVNCAALPQDLVESELFGHERGAFTDAVSERKGRFELAHGGTLFLDEIADMPLPAQAKLLRVLQERQITRVGGQREIQVDVRVVAATNRDLLGQLREGGFREDLYYRLCVLEIEVPPLRNRRGDVGLLAQHFLDRLNERGKTAKRLCREILQVLDAHSWPGNVRQLENAIRSMYELTAGEVLDAAHLPRHVLQALGPPTAPPARDLVLPPDGFDLSGYLRDLEQAYYERALELSGGNRAEAARRLGIQPPAFRRKLREEFQS